jgi:hypothetical protein
MHLSFQSISHKVLGGFYEPVFFSVVLMQLSSSVSCGGAKIST